MNIITVIPIYRNNFQKPAIFFSQRDFSVGSIVLVPYSKTDNPKNIKEKPALIIEIDDLKSQKQFLRKNDIPINKMINDFEFKFLLLEIIEDIKTKSSKIKKPVEFSLGKLFTQNIKKELNKISETSDKSNIEKYIKKIDTDFISQKLRPFLKKKIIKNENKKGIQSIENLLISQNNNKKSSLHSEKHYLVSEIREYFGETAKKGKGSFSFYLGFFKRIPVSTIYQYWSEVKESRKSIKAQQKIFWWKIGQLLKKNIK
ncbi:hypothetical protein KKH36_00595 [Patescibacteria group bacterium]|nr:hypothetical protein [Patescibacteria group bacterium]